MELTKELRPIILYPHQARAASKLVGSTSLRSLRSRRSGSRSKPANLQPRRGLLAIHSTGSGKTLLAAGALRALFDTGSIGRAFVIARKSAVAQFAGEISRYAPERASDALVGTHKTIMGALQGARRAHGGGLRYALVVDEAHEYVNPKGKRFAELQAASRAASFVLLLTATPIINAPQDLAVLTALAKGVAVPDPVWFEREVLNNPAGFRAWFADCVDVHLIDKAASKDYPALHTHAITLPMSAGTRREYGRRLSQPSPFFMNLRQLSLGHGKVSEKTRWLVEHTKRWISEGEGKIVVYTSFLDRGAKVIRDALTRAGVKVLVIDGKSSSKERRRAALMFNRRSEEEPREDLHRDLRALVRSRRSVIGRSNCPSPFGLGQSGGRSRPSGSASFQAGPSSATPGPALACPPPGVLLTRFSMKASASASSSRSRRPAALTMEYYSGATPVPGGKRSTDAEREYAKSLAIPPPWSPAYVCVPNEKLLWVARDLTGKWQYRYSADWGDQQEYRKFLRLRLLAAPGFWQDFDAEVGAAIREGRASGSSPSARRRAETAIAARMLSRCFFRVGAEGTTSRPKKSRKKSGAGGRTASSSDGGGRGDEDEATFGVTSLRRRHLTVVGPQHVRICFRGKSGQTNRCDVRDPLLCSALRWLVGRSASASSRLFDPQITAASVRRFLGGIRPGLRPKDFRTYAANLALVRHLLEGPDPTKMKPSQRARRLAEGYRQASLLLNNTPRMAKQAYVFSGLWVLYQVDPTRFLAAAGGASSGPEAALGRFVQLFSDNKIDWRYMLRWFKESGGVANFMGPAQVLLITDAGSESIDLAGTRHIVFLDATWTPALEDQIIGRGQRFGSHAHLPESSRRLDVWKLFLSRTPGGSRKATPDTSIDAYMDALNQTKRESQAALYRRLAALKH